MNAFEQHSTETIAYKQEVTQDPITSAIWTITPSGATLTQVATTTTETTCMVSGMTAGKVYQLKVLITCESGQVFERTASIRCR